MNPERYKARMAAVKASPVERTIYMPPIKDSQRIAQACQVCKKPILVAKGEESKYHRTCRKFRHNKSKYEI